MKAEINMQDTNHNLVKQNLITIVKRNRRGNARSAYDVLKCSKCGAIGKRYGVSEFVELTGKKATVQHCIEGKPKEKLRPNKVRIKNVNAVGDNFKNLNPGSVHNVVDCPDEYIHKFKHDIWVMGMLEPVRLLPGEYTAD